MNLEAALSLADKHNLLFFSKKEKFYLLSHIKAISESGEDEKKAIDNKIIAYTKTKKPHLAYILKKSKKRTC
jgi:hypothetical protein